MEATPITLSPVEQFVKAVLEVNHDIVTPIPCTNERTPDFDVEFADARYIVEVKTREEDEVRVAARHETLRLGQVHGETEELKRNNTVSGIIEWGVDQIRDFGPAEAFRILWIHCGGSYADRHKHQFSSALYGSTRIYDLDDTDYKVDALYFRDSDFFRHRATLDGVIITMETGQETELFCLANDHSSKYETFRVSPLATAFPAGLYDPLTLEAAGKALIVRGSFDRRKADLVLAHLHHLTGRKLYNMDFTHATAIVAVPNGIIR